MKPTAESKELLRIHEALEYYNLSPRKFRALLEKGGTDFTVKYYNDRTLIIKSQLEKYLPKHPELIRRKHYSAKRQQTQNT